MAGSALARKPVIFPCNWRSPRDTAMAATACTTNAAATSTTPAVAIQRKTSSVIPSVPSRRPIYTY